MASEAPSSEPRRRVSTSSSSATISSQDAPRGLPDSEQRQSLFSVDPLTRESNGSSGRSIAGQDGEIADGSRKRNNGRADESSADEAAPIMRSALAKRDYQSISPNIAPKNSSNSTAVEGGGGRTAQEGTTVSRQKVTRQESAEREAAAISRNESGHWRAFLDKYGSVELENKGSVARDHLALERTFLAWLRTSLSFASIGIAVTQLFRLNSSISDNNPSGSSEITPPVRLRHVGKPLGATFIGISIVILFIGFHRYFEAQHYVIRGKFPASRGSVIMVSLIAGALILTSLVVILAVAPGAFED